MVIQHLKSYNKIEYYSQIVEESKTLVGSYRDKRETEINTARATGVTPGAMLNSQS